MSMFSAPVRVSFAFLVSSFRKPPSVSIKTDNLHLSAFRTFRKPFVVLHDAEKVRTIGKTAIKRPVVRMYCDDAIHFNLFLLSLCHL